VAQHFYEAAGISIDMEYWTAAGVLIVHSAIALSDALCIRFSGLRSAGFDHDDAIALLEVAVQDGEEKRIALTHFRRIIEEKSRVSYLGVLYGPREIHAMWRHLGRFKEWAFKCLDV
jgi:hypothetical protein